MSHSFSPGHISCVFQPHPSPEHLRAGSRGFGIRLSLGTHCEVCARSDNKIRITIDGEESAAPVTRTAVTALSQDRGFDVFIENDLPVSQGFGMSATGALSAASCVAEEMGLTQHDAVRAAHVADVMCGGGLGDVVAIAAGFDVPVRLSPGAYPYGVVEGRLGRMDDLILVVLGPKMVTGSVLSDRERLDSIYRASEGCMDRFLSDCTVERLFHESNVFSSSTRLESDDIRLALDRLHSEGYHAGMCMLGNSVFTDAPADEVERILGVDPENLYRCSSYSNDLKVTRKV